MTNLKRIIVKEEFVLLTGHIYRAILLEYLLTLDPNHNWISKKSEDLSLECLLYLSKQTIRKHIKIMIDDELLFERQSPDSVWNKTIEYKVNYPKIQDFLKNKFSIESISTSQNAIFEKDDSNDNSLFSKPTISKIDSNIPEIKLSDQSKSENSADSIFKTSNSKKSPSIILEDNSSSLFEIKKTSDTSLNFDEDYYLENKNKLKQAFQRSLKK